ncbi:MAG: pentapeptide repeat-containing protein [Proteobacteria bacterium]|nr:pentapeptide repeat-containing protein [Pseudomonadota bacterium]
MTDPITLLSYSKPALASGSYSIKTQQTLKGVLTRGTNTTPLDLITPAAPTETSFQVGGPRTVLASGDIAGVFPPRDGHGDFSTALPSVILSRATLPWERSPGFAGDNPWLALLVFAEGEAFAASTVTIGSLAVAGTGAIVWPAMPIELDEDANAQVSVLDVQKSLLAAQLPTVADLPFTAHVRQPATASAAAQAVVLASRVPRDDQRYVAHLVSLAGRYFSGGFQFGAAGDTDSIRLISLAQWSWSSERGSGNFTSRLSSLDRSPSSLRMPPVSDSTAEAFLSTGHLALPQQLRGGGQTYARFHGPLAPGGGTLELTLPVHVADELLLFDSTLGMFDVSYAAAWQLGRMLMLQNQAISNSLYNWKRAHKQSILAEETRLVHLPFEPTGAELTAAGGAAPVPVPADVSAWFGRLALLEGVPYRYLIPDAAMLPPESLRVFRCDPAWMQSLLDGAFSIGRVTTTDVIDDGNHLQSPATYPHKLVTGFVMRSSLVSGWPDMVVSACGTGAYGAAGGPPLNLLRSAQIQPNVQLYLFDGEIGSITISQRPESMHCGFATAGPADFSLNPRVPSTSPFGVPAVRLNWRNAAQATLSLSALAGAMPFALPSVAQFARQLIAPTTGATFNVATPNLGAARPNDLRPGQYLIARKLPAALPASSSLSLSGLVVQSYGSISGMELGGYNLTGLNLNYGCIIGSNFKGGALSGVVPSMNLPDAVLKGVQAFGVQAQGATVPDGWTLVDLSPSQSFLANRAVLVGPGCSLAGQTFNNVNFGACDLSGANLAGATFNNCTFTAVVNGVAVGANMSRANVAGTNFFYCDMTGVRMVDHVGTPNLSSNNCMLYGDLLVGPSADLRNANLARLDMSSQSWWLIQPSLANADLRGALLTDSNLSHVMLAGAQLQGAKLTRANLDAAYLTTAQLSGVRSGGVTGTPSLPPGWLLVNGWLVGDGVDLAGADLRNQSLAGCNLGNADLSGALLDGVSSGRVTGTPTLPAGWKLVYGYLVGPRANLTGANFLYGDFTGANLAGADLTGTNVQNVILGNVRSGNITGNPQLSAPWVFRNGFILGPTSDLTNCNLEGTDLSGLDLSQATLTGARFCVAAGAAPPNVRLPDGWAIIQGWLVGPGADLTGATFENCTIAAASLRGVNLTDATLHNVTFSAAIDLTGATLQGIKSGGLSFPAGPPVLPTGWILNSGTLLGPGCRVFPGYYFNMSICNLADIDLSGSDLSGMSIINPWIRYSLSNINFRGANLSGVLFPALTTSLCDFTGANLSGASFNGPVTLCDFTGADFTGIQPCWSNWTDCILPTGWTIRSAAGTNPNYNMPIGPTVNFNMSPSPYSFPVYFCAEGLDLSGLDLSGAFVDGISLQWCNFTGARMQNLVGTPVLSPGAVFYNQCIIAPGADLRGADLSGAVLDRLDLTGADFSGANLTGASFNNSNLTNVRFVGADLTNAVMHNTGLCNTDFSGARLYGIDTQLPPDNYYYQWAGGVGWPAKLNDAILPAPWKILRLHFVGPGAKVTGMNPMWDDFVGTDLTGARLSQIYFGPPLGPVTVPANAQGLRGVPMDWISIQGIAPANIPLPDGWTILGDPGVLVGPTVNLDGIWLANCDLGSVDLSGARLAGVRTGNISGTPKLPPRCAIIGGYLCAPGVTFMKGYQAWFMGWQFQPVENVDLTGADFNGLTSGCAAFNNVDLTRVNMAGCNFSGATFANITSSGITQGTSDLPAGWRLVNGALLGPTAIVSGVSFDAVSLANLDLSGSKFTDCSFAGATFSGANLSNVTFTRCGVQAGALAGANISNIVIVP